MYSNFVPTHLLPYADQLIADLKALNAKPSYCPYCQYNQFYLVHDHPKYYRCKACHKGFNRSLNTPFYRLTPIEITRDKQFAYTYQSLEYDFSQPQYCNLILHGS